MHQNFFPTDFHENYCICNLIVILRIKKSNSFSHIFYLHFHFCLDQSHSVHPLSTGGEGVEHPIKFSKRGRLGRTSTLRGGLLEKRRVTFFRGAVAILQKNKLRSEIFNEKKIINKIIFLCHNYSQVPDNRRGWNNRGGGVVGHCNNY